MKSFNFSKKFEQVTSLVLAIMLLLSVFTASNVAVFADSNNKSTKTKNSDSEVNLYVKSDVQPFIKSSSDSEYKIISKTNAEDDYYSAKVKKSSSASTADTANITYRLANFSVDNNKVYFIKPSNWNIDNYKIYAYVWDGANNFTKEMSVVKSTEKNNFYCEENNTLSHLNNADKNELYYADFSNNSNYKNYKNILFFANETGVVENNPQMKTDDFELNYGSVYFGNDKNYACKTIGNIKEVGSQFTATDDMIVSVQDNNISILKESDLNIDIVDSYHRVQLRNGIQISFWKYKSDVHFECSKYDTEKFGELTYYYTENNVEKIIDGGKLSEIIKNNDVNVIVKLGNIPLKIYTNVKVNTGLTIDSIKWNYKTNVNSHISGNNVYVPSSCEKFELAVDSLEITGAKLNGEKLEGEALKGINIIDKNISNSQTVYQKDKVENTVENTFECQIKEVKYLGETYKYPINDLYNFNFTDTVNSHFVDVSVTVDDNYGKYAFIDSENNYIYQNGSEKCKYIVTPTSNDIKTDEITVISNSGKISYEKGIITVQQGLTEDTEFTVKYPHEDGFEVKTYTIKPDNDAPEIESIVFTKKENDTLKNYGLYSSDEIEFKITIKDKDNVNVAGVDNEALSCADDYFEINPPEYNETDKTITYTCILNKSITSSDNKIFNKIFKVKDKVSNSAEYSLSDLIDKNNTKVSVGDEEIINESFEVVSNSNDKNIEVKNTFNGDNYDDEKHIIGSGKEVSVTSVISDKLSGINNIGNFKCTYSDGTSVNITDVSGKDLSGVDTVAYSYVDNGETTKTTEVELKYTIKTENSGKYELSYTVTNNSGVKKDVSETFYVDNTAPNVTNVDFVKTSNPSVSDQILNFLTFGIYSNDTIVMKVTATDSAPTSGFDKIDDAIEVVDGNGIKIEKADSSNATKNGEVTNTAASNATQESNVTYSFELGNSDDLSFTVKDKANNVNENIALADLVKDNKVKANDNSLTEEQLKNVSNVFEVVSSTKKPTAEVSSYNATGTKAFNDNNIYHGDQLTVTLNLNNDISGLQSISDLSVRGFESSNFSNFKLTKINGKDQSFSANSFDELAAEFKNQATNEKVKSATVTFDINIKDNPNNPNYRGSHKLSLTVTDNSGNVNTEVVNSTFYVDNTAPEITKVEFVKTTNPTVTDQILKFLTFGIYSNDTIVMNVTATDNAPTSGLPSDSAITVKNDNKENLDVKEKKDEKLASNATDSSTVTYSYNLGNSDSAYVLSFTVKDNAGNTATKSLVDLIKEDKEKTEKVVVANANITKVDYDKIEGFEVVSNNDSTKIDAKNTFEGTNFDDNSNPIIRSGDTVSVVSNIKDQFTGINKIGGFSCKWNDSENVKITDNDNNLLSSETFSYDYVTDKKTTDVTLNYNISTKESGKYVLTYTVTNNAGVKKTFDETFYVDNTAPVIRDFTFENGKTAENPDSVIKTEYGYYFKNTTTVEVTAVDGEVDSLVSGVSEIHFYTIEKGKTAPSNIQEVLVSGYNQTSYKATTFEVPANFKGNVYAYAVDKAGNCYNFDTTTNKNDSQPVTPDRVVVENSSKHEQMSGIDISLPATNYVENSNKLYNNDVNVALNVSDTYSGIAKIEYSVSSEFDKDNNWDGSIKYLNDQSAETNMNGNGTVSGWKIEESDQNLVTKASSTITVKNNSNNIKIEVKLTDRAGNVSTKKETLSIDKTKPTIKIEYDNNNHTTHNGTEFYKANRTATITVTERNFSPEDVISKITNADNVITQITGWTTHNVANGENPDGTTHTATVVYASDGDYTFDIAFTDMAGNKADKVAQHKFTIDKTIPVISVSFDNNSAKNNNYFKADRTATITVNEHNFNAADVKVNISATGADNSTSATAPSVSSWTNNGNVHTATISFAKDGKYAFDVNYTDLADNAAKENVVTTFYVDKTAPTVKISNVVNESANSGNVAPVISLSDNNYSGDYVLSLTRVDINAKKTDVTNDFASTVVPTNNIGAVVTYANFASEEVNDGIYVLNATLTDKAGNSSADTITFSVNRFGSTYMGGDEETNALLDNGYTNAEKDIVISEINVDKLTKSNISLSLDSSSLKTLKQNVDYTIQEDAKTGQWHRYNYTVKSSNFENEGNYTLELSSTDAAKNTSTNRIRPVEKRKLAVQFVVDKTSPVVNIAGIENNALYEENSKDVTIVCEDSYINPSSLVINLDNKTLKEGKDYTVEKDVASITAKIKVNATSDISSQNIKVSVKDMAQNSGDGSVENFTLSATVLMRFFANPVLVIISAVILAGIIVMVVLIVAKKRKNN